MNMTSPNFSQQCDNTLNISSWKACQADALDREMRDILDIIKATSFTLMVIGIISSSLVCMVILRIRRVPQRKISNALTLNLAIADIMFRIVYVITRGIVPTMHIDVSALGCKTMLFSHYACAAVTFALLAGMAIDRYQQIIYPLKYFYLDKRRRIMITMTLWVYSILVAMGFFFIGEDTPYQMSGKVPKRFRRPNNTIPETVTYKTKSSKHCTLAKNSVDSQLAFTPYFVFAFFVPLLIIIITYSAVFRFLRARSRHRINRVTAKSKRKALKMLIVVVASFVVCWAPIMLVDLLRVYGALQSFRLRGIPVRHFAESFSHSSSIISPVIYAFGNANFRKELRKVLKAVTATGLSLLKRCHCFEGKGNCKTAHHERHVTVAWALNDGSIATCNTLANTGEAVLKNIQHKCSTR